MPQDRAKLQEAIDLCLEARKTLDEHGSFRARVLMEMLLVELGKEVVKSAPQGADWEGRQG